MPLAATTNILARVVIDASGTWNAPNPAGADGLLAPGEREAADRVAYGIPDVLRALRQRYVGKSAAVVGGGHSALNALIELTALKAVAPATSILSMMRKDNVDSVYGGEETGALPAHGALGSQARQLFESGAVRVLSPFRVEGIERGADGALAIIGDHAGVVARVAAAELIVATDFRPDLAMLREIRLTLDP
jgi:hypothetical protein